MQFSKTDTLLNWRIWVPPSIMAVLLIGVAQFDFLTFHTLAEFFAIIISFLLVVFAWSTRNFSRNNFLLFLANGYFWIGSLDLVHTLVYKGMNLYVEGSAALSVQFWIGARYLEAFLLLVAPFAINKRQNGYLLFSFFGFLAIGLTSLIMTGNFPDGFIEGQGLTQFKIYSEYTIVFILFVALLALFRYGHNVSTQEKQLIAASILLTIGAELAFTFYVSVYGLSNLVGHIFKLFSYWLIFQAVVISNLQKPFYELKALTDYNRFLFNNSPIGLFLTDMSGTLVEINTTFSKIIGRTVETTLPLSPSDISPSKYASEDRRQLSELEEKGSYGPYEKEFIHRDGHLISVQLSGKIVEQKNSRFILSSVEDISERKKLEDQLRHSQKMDAVGQLTGGIAHDFNNILGIVMGNLEIIEDGLSDNNKLHDRVHKAIHGVERGAEITRKLLGYSRKKSSETGAVIINDVIDNLKDLIDTSLTASIKIDTKLSKDLWRVAVDPGEFEDALLNLSLNARDAMPDGGVLVIETKNKILDAEYASRNPESGAGKFVMISISDTGLGMSKELQERVLEPFFTTKDQGKGTGLGLSMVYGFVHRAGGHLKIYSDEGNGTTFRLYIPKSEEEENRVSTKSEEIYTLPTGKETILIVDDEEALREIAASHLNSLGYKTLMAEDCSKAWKILNSDVKIDLLFSDTILPGEWNGYDLAKHLRDKDPSFKIRLTSGFSRMQREYKIQKDPLIRKLSEKILSKPYNKMELANSIRNALDDSN